MTPDGILLIAIFILNAGFVVLALFSIRQQRRTAGARMRLTFARDFVMAAYDFQRLFHEARDPLVDIGEYYHRPRDNSESAADKQRLDERYALKHRIQKLYAVMPKLEALNWEASLLLKKDFFEEIQTYRKMADDLNKAIDQYFGTEFTNMVAEGKISPKTFEEIYDRIYGFSTDNFGKKITQVTEALAKKVRESLN